MFKNLKTYFLISIIFTSCITITTASSEVTNIKLSKETVKAFYNYISSDRGPLDKFLITTDGSGVFVWACPQTLCFPAGDSFYTKPCSKLNDNKPCKIFAVKRKIKFNKQLKIPKNLVTFTQGDTLREVSLKLKKLGFID